MLIKKMLHWLF